MVMVNTYKIWTCYDGGLLWHFLGVPNKQMMTPWTTFPFPWAGPDVRIGRSRGGLNTLGAWIQWYMPWVLGSLGTSAILALKQERWAFEHLYRSTPFKACAPLANPRKTRFFCGSSSEPQSSARQGPKLVVSPIPTASQPTNRAPCHPCRVFLLPPSTT